MVISAEVHDRSSCIEYTRAASVSDYFVVVTLATRDRLRLSSLLTNIQNALEHDWPGTRLLLDKFYSTKQSSRSGSVTAQKPRTRRARNYRRRATGHRPPLNRLLFVRRQPIGDFRVSFTDQSAVVTTTQPLVPAPPVVCHGRLSIFKRTAVRFLESRRSH